MPRLIVTSPAGLLPRFSVVVVRPITGIVIKFWDVINFIFRFYIAVLCRTNVDTDAVFIKICEIYWLSSASLAINCDAPPRARAQFFSRLVFGCLEIANAGRTCSAYQFLEYWGYPSVNYHEILEWNFHWKVSPDPSNNYSWTLHMYSILWLVDKFFLFAIKRLSSFSFIWG